MSYSTVIKENIMKRYSRLICLITVGAMANPTICNAEIITDGTVGPATAITGPNYDIAASLGTLSGANLFHSFTTFNINTGETATFNGPASAGVTNIIGRVTGGSFSNIDGEIGSDVTGANLWLVNPAGIVFGSNASINVSGSFHASTAENVKFDGSEFGTSVVSSPVLSVANPEGFGFVSTNPASIFVNGSSLAVSSGQTLSLVAGDINLINATVSAPDGRINLAAVDSAGDITFTEPAATTESGINASGVTAMADINVTGTTVTVSGDGGGDIYISGGAFVLDPDSTVANNSVDTDGGVTHISGTNITIDEGIVRADTNGGGNGADIVIQGDNLTVKNNTSPPTTTGIIARVDTSGSGNGGNIDIDMTGTVSVEQGGVIRTLGRNGVKGGDINIDANGLQIISGGKVFTDSFDGVSAGDAAKGGITGNININTANSVLVSGFESKLNAQTYGKTGTDAVNVSLNITTGTFTLDDQAQISADSFNSGVSAGINIAAENVTVSNYGQLTAQTADASGGGITITATKDVVVTSDARISTDTFYDGDGSSLDITADNVLVSDGARVSASTKRNGQAGAINVNATNIIRVTGRNEDSTGFFSVSGDPDPFFGSGYFGVGGDINLTANTIVFESGAIASAEAINLGNAGNISLDTADKVEIMSSTLQTSADSSAGGNIGIQAVNLVHVLNSDITAEAFGVTPGNDGGNVTIDPVNVVLNNSNLLARANAGNGGNITVASTAFLRTPTSDLNATSRTGIDGEVLIETLNQNVTIIPVVSESFLDITALLSNRCAAQRLKSRSSFTIELNNGIQPDRSSFHHYDHLANGERYMYLQQPYLFTQSPLLDLACL